MIEILDFKPQTVGICKARFTVRFPKMGLDLRECTFMRMDDGRQWVGMPSKQYEAEGKKKYFAYVKFSEEMQPKFEAAVLKALEPFLNPKEAEHELPF